MAKENPQTFGREVFFCNFLGGKGMGEHYDMYYFSCVSFAIAI